MLRKFFSFFCLFSALRICDRQEFFDLEKKCDDAVQDVIEEVRSQLKKEHYPEEYADKIFNAYKSEKGYMIAYYMENLK